MKNIFCGWYEGRDIKVYFNNVDKYSDVEYFVSWGYKNLQATIKYNATTNLNPHGTLLIHI